MCGHDAVRQRPPPGVCRTVVSFPPQKADDPGGREFLNALLRSSAGCTVRLAGGKRFPDPDVKANDTVLVNLETGKIENKCKFEVGAMCMIKGGNNTGRVKRKDEDLNFQNILN